MYGKAPVRPSHPRVRGALSCAHARPATPWPIHRARRFGAGMTRTAATDRTLDAHALVDRLVDPNPHVRFSALHALNKADQATITAHITHVGGMLTDPDTGVRGSALIVIGRAEQAAFNAYAGTIASMLAYPYYPGHDDGVRYIALGLFASKCAFGMLTPDVMKLARSGITTMLVDNASIRVRDQAKCALDSLQKQLVQFHWATVRDLCRVRPYALFWHEYTGKQLCAPGGMWEGIDRASFEAEFSAELDQ